MQYLCSKKTEDFQNKTNGCKEGEGKITCNARKEFFRLGPSLLILTQWIDRNCRTSISLFIASKFMPKGLF